MGTSAYRSGVREHTDSTLLHPRDVVLSDATGEIALVPLHRADIPKLVEVLDRTYSDPDLGWRMYGADRASDAVRLMRSAHDTCNGMFWAVLCDGQIVGVFGVARYLGVEGDVATATYLDGPARGTGLNSELKNLVRDGAAQCGVRLVASVARDNARSNAAMRTVVHADPSTVYEPWARREANVYAFPLARSASSLWPQCAVDAVAALIGQLATPALLAA